MIETLTTNNANVSADADRTINVANIGVDGVFDTLNKFAATIISNNCIRLSSGILIHKGAYLRINEGTTEDLTIDNGSSGTRRKDLIVAHFESQGGIHETHDIRVLKNTNSPTAKDLLLYEVNINGINIESVVPKFKLIKSIEKERNETQDSLTKLFNKLGGVDNDSMNVLCNFPLRRKDISKYVKDGSLWSRIAGTNGYKQYDDIYVGDYIVMSRAITCIDSYNGETGTNKVMVISCGGLYGNGDSGITYNHLVMAPGGPKGERQHFGRHRMNPTNTTTGGYKASEMNTDVVGPVVSSGSTATGATINQQLYAEFGSHLKTTKELLTNSMSASLYNRWGSAGGAANGWEWVGCQAVLMSEIETYGSTVWGSSGFDTGVGSHQFELFAMDKSAMNNRTAYYWLKDIASATLFCNVNDYGYADYTSASHPGVSVRPRFVLA